MSTKSGLHAHLLLMAIIADKFESNSSSSVGGVAFTRGSAIGKTTEGIA